MAAAMRNLQQKQIRFVGRSVNDLCHIHQTAPSFICAIYSFPQVSIAAITG